MEKIEKLITTVQNKVNDKRYYYSQNRENKYATDCSWLLITSLQEIGIATNGATYTGNMCKELVATGYFNLITFNSTKLQRGDILVKHISGSNGHTVLYIGNNEILEACNKKYGLRRCKYYANGYQYILRMKDATPTVNLPLLKNGSKGIEVCFLQLFLNKYQGNKLIVDGEYGSRTTEAVKNFQMKYTDIDGKPLEIDGIVGEKTWTKIYFIMVNA